MTRFAKFTRTLRIQNDEYLGQMARRLNVSTAFLSRIENGKAKPSEKIVNGLCTKYSLNEEQVKELHEIVDEARQKISLSSLQLEPAKEQMVYRFAKSINDFSDDELNEIYNKIIRIERGAAK